MKKQELEEACGEEGFIVSFGDKNTIVRLEDTGVKAITISEEVIYSMNIDFSGIDFSELDYSVDRNAVIKACVDYASTPPKERSDEVKYKLYHRYMNNPKDSQYYKVSLTLDENDCLAVVRNEEFLPSHQIIKKEFTEEEIKQIKEMYRTTLDDFEIYEVGEDDQMDF